MNIFWYQNQTRLTIFFINRIYFYPCQIEPYTTPDNLYRAVRLGYPNVQAQFRTVLKNETGHVIDSRIFNTDLNKGEATVLVIMWSLGVDRHGPGLVHDAPHLQPGPGLCPRSGLVSHARSRGRY